MDDKIYELNTPAYILDESKLTNNFLSLKSAFEKFWNNDFIVGYSFKTNSLPYVISWMKEHGAYAEIVSETEYELAKAVGFGSSNIVYNGPVKGEKSFLEVLNADGIVNLDSFSEIELLKNSKPEDGKIWKIGLRINFDLEKECPSETIMGELPGRFGFNIENGSLERAIIELQKLSYIKIAGFHGHHSTKTKSLKIFSAICKKLVYVADLINNDCEYVDVGGCIFGDKPGAPSFEEYANVITTELKKSERLHNAKLILEPGASLIASPFSYLSEVVDVKEVHNTIIVTTNGSLIHIDPQMHGITFNKEVFYKKQHEKAIDSQIIAGFTCIEKDRLGLVEKSQALKKGDRIMFNNTGAYSMALSPLFIQYYPSVYVKQNSDYALVREPWTVKEYLSKCEIYK